MTDYYLDKYGSNNPAVISSILLARVIGYDESLLPEEFSLDWATKITALYNAAEDYLESK